MEKIAVKVSKATRDFLTVQALENRRSLAMEAGLLLDEYVKEKKNPKPVFVQRPAMQVPMTVPVSPTAAPRVDHSPAIISEVPDTLVPAVPIFPMG